MVPLAKSDLRGEVRHGHGTRIEKSVMKKSVTLAILALAMLAMTEQKAAAWTQVKFGFGANFSLIGGGNRILWGAFCSSPVPCGYPCDDAGWGYAPVLGGGDAIAGYFANHGEPTSTTAVSGPANNLQTVDYQGLGYGAGPYQPVNYGYYQGASYWYGR